MSSAFSVSFYRTPAISCSMFGRTFPLTIFFWWLVNTLFIFFRTSLVGSTVLSMTYSINVCPYNDAYIKIAEEAVGAITELLIPGAFLVDIVPILKYVPKWFPGAKFQSKAASMRKHAAIMRNSTFSATEELMVCDFLEFLPWWYGYDLRPAVTMIPRSSRRFYWKISNIPTPLIKILICWKMLPSRRMRVSSPIVSFFQLTEQYLSGSRYYCFVNWNFFFGNGLLSRGAEGGSSRTWHSSQWKTSRT